MGHVLGVKTGQVCSRHERTSNSGLSKRMQVPIAQSELSRNSSAVCKCQMKAYVEDMMRLFRRADPRKTEEKKVRYLMRGVKEQFLGGPVHSP